MKKSARYSAGADSILFLAGQTVPAGTYRSIETGQAVRFDREDVLPATCSGQVAVYVRQALAAAERMNKGQV